ncbi:3-phosphoserine/phosphohydroxythreonine transaminase, partial [uncultured Campylobacter sp.]|uniref:3-phosphoserine/phosphohydroxythreonine transaminase n=1 Tax=uncultured Campylobacter sp. TaxID=218934 RepID=UPI00260DF6E4
EAGVLGINYRVVASSEESKFDRIPEVKFSNNADYGYICSNNTIYGTQYPQLPQCGCPLVVDSSSDLFSRPVDLGSVGMFYGGIQKNGGPAGVTMVAIRKDLLDRADPKTPMILRYKTQADADSMSNTPNTFGIYMLNLMLGWIKDEIGGLAAMHERNKRKAALLYGAIDASGGFYRGHAQKDSRSLMNVSFNIADAALEPVFVAQAEAEGMIGLKGHRVLGGIRASIYNAINYEDVEKLVTFMSEFARKNG